MIDQFTSTFKRVPGGVLIAIAAGMWGFDALFRGSLQNHGIAPETIVFNEHLLLVIFASPLLFKSLLSAKRNLDWKGWLSILAIGIGASAVATLLFTHALFKSYSTGDNGITVFLLQKLQPIVAVSFAAILLKERLHEKFWIFFIIALAAGYSVTFGFSDKLHVKNAEVSLLAISAAVLWGFGTVLGRYLSDKMKFEEVATLRFFFGLVGAGIALRTGPHYAAFAPAKYYPNLIGIALLTGGLIPLMIYYFGIKRTPASIATLSELTFVASATIVGVIWQKGHMDAGQWIGSAVLVLSVTALGLLSAKRKDYVEANIPRSALPAT